MEKRSNDLVQNAVIVILILLLGAVAFICYPLYTYIFEGARPLIVTSFIPFTDPETTTGYYVNIIHQLVLAHCGTSFSIGVEIAFVLIVNAMSTGVEVIKHSFEELPTGQWSVQDNRKFRNILLRIQDVEK